MKSKEAKWTDYFTENGSYKIVALLIALILWVTVLGRRDFSFTKSLDVEVKTAAGFQVTALTADRVKVRVAGPRNLIKKYIEDTAHNSLNLDFSDRESGVFEVDLSSNIVDVPNGLRILSVKPNIIRIEVAEKKH